MSDAKASWWSALPGPIWGVITLALTTMIGDALISWRARSEVTQSITVMQRDLSELNQGFKSHVAIFRTHEMSISHAGMQTIHTKDMDQIKQAFDFQQQFLRNEFGKVDTRLGRIETEVKKD